MITITRAIFILILSYISYYQGIKYTTAREEEVRMEETREEYHNILRLILRH